MTTLNKLNLFAATHALKWGLFFITILGTFFLYRWGVSVNTVQVSTLSSTLSGNNSGQNAFPLAIAAGEQRTTLALRVSVYASDFRHIEFKANRCVERIEIEGEAHFVHNGTPCKFGRWKSLRKIKAASHNSFPLVAVIHGGKDPGLFSIRVSKTDPLSVGIHLALLMLVASIAWQLMKLLFWAKVIHSPFRFDLGVSITVVASIVGTFLYFESTGFQDRTHDLDGHLDYLRFVLKNFSVPNAQSCWECSQAPLYYFLMAPIVKLTNIFSNEGENEWRVLSFCSFLFISSAVIVKARIAMLLFPPSRSLERALVILLSSLTPAVVFHSSTINNDSLQHLVLTIFILVLIKWWRNSTTSGWFWVVGLGCISILTKANGYCFFALAFALLVLDGLMKKTLPRTFAHAAAGAFIFVISIGWYLYQRLLPTADYSIFGPTHFLKATQSISFSWRDLLVFNPVNVFTYPFLPWDNNVLRSHFWEVLFRTVFFDEWKLSHIHPFVVKGLLFLGIISLLFVALGILKDKKENRWSNLPVLLILACCFGSIFLYAYTHPLVTTINIRYASVALLPLSYYAVCGISLSRPWFRISGISILLSYVTLCIAFILCV